MIKYSIVLPVRNAGAYLPTCVQSVISQHYDDYELIISNNHSSDGTTAYLETLTHANIKKIAPPQVLCMGEHFEWALSHAQGRWCMLLGADDGLLPYFFELADCLTQQAEKKHLRAIMSRRAYYFWPGCELLYGRTCVSYVARMKIEKRSIYPNMLNALFGISSYFDLPQMYTNSLFSRSFLDEVRQKQRTVFTAIIPDANLAALCCSLENHFLYSHIPLGWIGTSPASNGFSVSASNLDSDPNIQQKREQNERSNDFFALNSHSCLTFDARLGNPKLLDIYALFLDSLFKTTALRTPCQNRILMSKGILILVIAKELNSAKNNAAKLSNVRALADNFNIPWWSVHVLSASLTFISLPLKVWRRLCNQLYKACGKTISWNSTQQQSMIEAGRHIEKALRRKHFLPLPKEPRQR